MKFLCTDPNGNVVMTSGEDLLPGTALGTYRLPKVAACYFHDQSDPISLLTRFVEVTIVYEQKIAGHWTIQGQRYGYDPDGLPQGYFVPCWSDPPEPPGLDFDEFNLPGGDQIHPDVAYDPRHADDEDDRKGDIYIVFTRAFPNGVAHVYMIKGLRIYQEDNYTELDDWDYVFYDENWPYEYQPVQKYEGVNEHNAFNARIDIGKVSLPIPPDPEDWKIIIAYTGGNYMGSQDNCGGWHVRINYWNIDDDETNGKYRNHNYAVPLMILWGDPPEYHVVHHPAGFPAIDIGPPDTNHAALVWTQAKTSDWSNSTVVYIDSHLDFPEGFQRFSPDPGWGSECTALPSVVVHEDDDGQFPFFTSISCLRSDDYVSGYWKPMARFLRIDSGSSVLQGGAIYLEPDSKVGKWDPGAMVEHGYGMSTTMTALNDNYYWMIFSGSEQGAGPSDVYGTLGYTTF
jgi:hypothetical protein